MWINGSDLTTEQRQRVLLVFVYRAVKTNPQRVSELSHSFSSDEEWLKAYRFEFDAKGKSLKGNYCEPLINTANPNNYK